MVCKTSQGHTFSSLQSFLLHKSATLCTAIIPECTQSPLSNQLPPHAEPYRPTVCRAELTEQDVEDAIQRRSDARKSKDFAAADGVRDELAAKGVAIMDLPGGTTWRPVVAQNES